MAKKKAASAKSKNISVNLSVRVWVSGRDGRIRIVLPPNQITTVTNVPGTRYHKALYSKLRTVLKNRGKWPVGMK
jgi:hypothetical protein